MDGFRQSVVRPPPWVRRPPQRRHGTSWNCRNSEGFPKQARFGKQGSRFGKSMKESHATSEGVAGWRLKSGQEGFILLIYTQSTIQGLFGANLHSLHFPLHLAQMLCLFAQIHFQGRTDRLMFESSNCCLVDMRKLSRLLAFNQRHGNAEYDTMRMWI